MQLTDITATEWIWEQDFLVQAFSIAVTGDLLQVRRS